MPGMLAMSAASALAALMRTSCALIWKREIEQRKVFIEQALILGPLGEPQLLEKTHAAAPDEIAALWQTRIVLAIKQGVQPIANSCAQPRPVKSLTQLVLAQPRGFARHVRAGHQIASQQCYKRRPRLHEQYRRRIR